VDTHHPEGILPNNMTTFVFVLRCDPAILIRRLRRKKWGKEKIRENVMAEILDYCLIHAQAYYTNRKLVQLDTSHSSVKQSVKTAMNILSGTKAPLLQLNWLTKLETDVPLSKYLGC
jgi:adenylate kinase